MCGFAGFLDRSVATSADDLRATVTGMADTLRRRGPDDGGAWVDATAGIALGFRRLAIVDLSPEGHQPMVSASGRFVIAFNGEIYNFLDLRKELQCSSNGRLAFRGTSDTEVMLAAIEAWGLDNALPRFAGMFAFALWDRRQRKLHLCRDRIGEKPLYYGWVGNVFLFGSELKALRRHTAFLPRVRRESLAPYLRNGYIPSPFSIYEGIFKQPPGTALSIPVTLSPGLLPDPQAYWSVRRTALQAMSDRLPDNEVEVANQLDSVLRNTIRQEMIADVPLGAFLSGGIDSSTVVALMQAESARPVRTFTIGFHECAFNEADQARAVARHLATDHTELYVTPAEMLAVIPRLPEVYDEPFADSSQVPTFLVAQMARSQVTVSLSGDGGDEVFAGYEWYRRNARLWHQTRLLPAPLRRLAGHWLSGPRNKRWARLLGALRHLVPGRLRRMAQGDRLGKLGALLAHADRSESLHQWLISAHWEPGHHVLLDAPPNGFDLTDSSSWPTLEEVVEELQCCDLTTYLPDDILVKVDRASMGFSLESRAPFLDHRVVEFAWRIPSQMKMRHGQGKWILRQVLHRYVPKVLVERPKRGFSVPVDAWLRGPLATWAESLLAPSLLKMQGFFDPGPVWQLWQQHLAGTHDWGRHLWHLLMFQAWLNAHGG
jgi:asparagine synthase (glutamine-hydrolysing)